MIAPDVRRALVNVMALGQLTPREVANGIGISVQAVRKWCRAGDVDTKAARKAYTQRTLERLGIEVRRGQ